MALCIGTYNPDLPTRRFFCVVVAGYLLCFDLGNLQLPLLISGLVACEITKSVFVLLHNPSSFLTV